MTDESRNNVVDLSEYRLRRLATWMTKVIGVDCLEAVLREYRKAKEKAESHD